ncbi:uncharacterized protein [Typha latifolia]|uniref:uncharacterized protein n=1 Tax=Typha latifolia TaxID=4733 RepID=UPI003C2BEB73
MMTMTMADRVTGVGIGAVSSTSAASSALEEELSLPIILAERLRKAVADADYFKSECCELGRLADPIAESLRALVRCLSASPSPVYERPARRVAAEASKALDRALSLARRCRRRSSLLRRVAAIATGSADFRRAFSVLDASLADLKWLLSIYSSFDALSLPPIASTDPILAWVWSYIAAAQMSPNPSDRAEAAVSLANHALDSHRNRKIIVEEGGVPPLLTLLRGVDSNSSSSSSSSLDAQIAAAMALANLATDHDLVESLLAEFAVSVVVQVLADSPMTLQTRVAELVARMADHDPGAQEEFARENAVRPLVSLLSFEVSLDDSAPSGSKKPTSIHSLVRINRDSKGEGSSSARDHHYYHHVHHRKEREDESDEVKLVLKVACAEALWMLSRDCISNSRKITETKGLLCLAKLIEKEKGELQLNCLMTIMEITAVAEADADLRRSAFKLNSPAAKAVVDQLLRLVQKGASSSLQIPAIKSIGFLARTFPARESRILRPLVAQLSHWNPDVAAEATVALGKFANPENFLHVEHCKAIIEFGGIPSLMRLLRPGEKTQLPALVLLCYLSLHVPSNEALERAKALGTLESVSRSVVAQHPSLKDLLPRAIYHLELYRAGAHIHIDVDPHAM